MKNLLSTTTYLSTTLFLLCAPLCAQKHKPLVIDNAQVLTKEQSSDLNFILNGYFNASNVEYTLFTLKSLKNKPISDYSDQIIQNLGIGDKKLNTGLLILLASDEKKIDITIGHGLEWFVTDSVKAQVLNEAKPFFQDGKFYEGVKRCFQRLYDPASVVPWSVSLNSFKELSYSLKKSKNKVIEFTGTSSTKNLINQNSRSPQFSARFFIPIKGENGRTARLYYSKNMIPLVKSIVAGRAEKIYARVTKTGPVRLDLMGIK